LKLEARLQPHNSIDRRSGTTNDSGFAPYGMNQYWCGKDTLLDIYLLKDEARLQSDELEVSLRAVEEQARREQALQQARAHLSTMGAEFHQAATEDN